MTLRQDRYGAHRQAYQKNRRVILKTQETCGICGRPVDKTLPAGDPMSATVDHIIPINKGGHPSALDNLQLAHWICNRQKSDKIFQEQNRPEKRTVGNRNLPQSRDWTTYKAAE
ncbi:MAG: HNH endonuclease signature motif containing protein [Eubacteriales bacterium]|nr:HNH endonuclease signature motif containing protein [Eubacteriales bacterium]